MGGRGGRARLFVRDWRNGLWSDGRVDESNMRVDSTDSYIHTYLDGRDDRSQHEGSRYWQEHVLMVGKTSTTTALANCEAAPTLWPYSSDSKHHLTGAGPGNALIFNTILLRLTWTSERYML